MEKRIKVQEQDITRLATGREEDFTLQDLQGRKTKVKVVRG